jgi:hypothetical protein
MQAEKKICLAFTTPDYNTQKCTKDFEEVIAKCEPCFTKMDASTKEIMSAVEITEDMNNAYKIAVSTCQQTENKISFLGKELNNCDEAYNELSVVKELNDHDGTVPLSEEGDALKEYIFRLNETTE